MSWSYLEPEPENLPSLSSVVEDASKEDQKEIPFTALDTPCCPNPPTCPEQEAWRAKFKGCQTSFATQPSMRCEVAPIGDRYWVADLNPLLYQRSMVSGALWNPYEHMNARQMFAQFINKDVRKDGDPYSRPIDKLSDSYCSQLARKGPPQYTSF